jgi:release factor glutamine methyltransferase
MTIRADTSVAHSAETLLAFAEEALCVNGIEEHRQEARWLIEEILNTDYARIRAGLAPAPTQYQVARFLACLDDRLKGVPLAHILGSAWFYGLKFALRPGILVPRPETEMLVEIAIKLLDSQVDSSAWILDCYTGCGNVLLSILHSRADVRGLGIDLDPVAIDCAEINRVNLRCDNAKFMGGDVAEMLPFLPRKHYLVTANPPYVCTDDISGLQREVAVHENRAALDGGPDGLRQLKVLAESVPGVLIDGGRLLAEIGDGQRDAVGKLFCGWSSVEFVDDLNGRPRVLVAQP